MHQLALAGLEADHGTRMVCLLLLDALFQSSIGKGSRIGEGLVELYNEIVLEILRYAPTVLGSVTDNFVLFGNDTDVGAFVQSIYHHIRIIFREGEAEDRSPFGRCQLGDNIVFGQIYLIIIGFGNLTLV